MPDPVDALVELAESRGLVARDFWRELHEEFCVNHHTDSDAYQRSMDTAGWALHKGLAAVFDIFLDNGLLTYEALERLVRSKGSVLLAIARAAAEEDAK